MRKLEIEKGYLQYIVGFEYNGEDYEMGYDSDHYKCNEEYPENIVTALEGLFVEPHDDIDLHEGDMFVFPSTILHCSPLNVTDIRKTVISFNMKVGNVTRLY